jgi:transcriptional regulator with XRE-family HTH domain
MRAKMALVAAREEGQPRALAAAVSEFPQYAAELADFHASLTATSGYADVTLTPEIEAIALRARERAFARVFPPAAPSLAGMVTQQATTTLRKLRQARGISQVAAARRLGLGADVLASLEHGKIRVASVPQRLLRALGEVLDVTADHVRLVLETQAAVMPALLRDRSRGGMPEEPMLDFADAVRGSPNMSAEEKAGWLEE